MSQWPTHRLIKDAIAPLERPPKSLVQGLESVSPLATHVFGLGARGLRRIHLWSGATLSAPPAQPAGATRQIRSRTVHRWRWFAQLPTRWLAFESLDRRKALHLIATAPAQELNIPLPRPAQSLMGALPAQGGGTWLFDSQGRYLKIDDSLRRTDAPGLVDRVRRIWRLHHLQRDHLASADGRPTKQSRLRGLAHRLALPVVLLGLPLLALIMLPLARRAGRGLEPTRPLAASLTRPAWPWIVTATLYLVAAGSLLWPFWQVTTAF